MKPELIDVVLNWVADGLTDADALYNQIDEDGWLLPSWSRWVVVLKEVGFTVTNNVVSV